MTMACCVQLALAHSGGQLLQSSWRRMLLKTYSITRIADFILKTRVLLFELVEKWGNTSQYRRRDKHSA